MAGLNRDAARRVVEATRFVEQQPRSKVAPASGPRLVPYQKVGKLTTALTARSGSTPGSATVQPYLITPTSITPLGSPHSISNWTGTALGSGKGVKYTVIDGYLWFDGEDCSGVAFP